MPNKFYKIEFSPKRMYSVMSICDAASNEQCRHCRNSHATEAQQTAVQNYEKKYGLKEIRQVQCGNTTFKSRHGHKIKDIKKRAADLEEFIERSPQWKGGTTYRGMSLSESELSEAIADLKAGTFTNLGSASWSTEKSVADRFAGYKIGEISDTNGDLRTNYVVLILKEQKHATSIQHLSKYAKEAEVLASKRCRYKFVKQYTEEGDWGDTTIYIEVEAI